METPRPSRWGIGGLPTDLPPIELLPLRITEGQAARARVYTIAGVMVRTTACASPMSLAHLIQKDLISPLANRRDVLNWRARRTARSDSSLLDVLSKMTNVLPTARGWRLDFCPFRNCRRKARNVPSIPSDISDNNNVSPSENPRTSHREKISPHQRW